MSATRRTRYAGGAAAPIVNRMMESRRDRSRRWSRWLCSRSSSSRSRSARAGALSWDFFTKPPALFGQPGGGIANAIVGTRADRGDGTAMALPVGVLTPST